MPPRFRPRSPRWRKPYTSVLLIGHNPGLHAFARRLAGTTQSEAAHRLADRYPTSALAEFAIPGPWRQPCGARLIRFLT